tara:strand:+ start:145 stop:525 length:381 start_codon:yes stop_codon:yes gene_type:complete
MIVQNHPLDTVANGMRMQQLQTDSFLKRLLQENPLHLIKNVYEMLQGHLKQINEVLSLVQDRTFLEQYGGRISGCLSQFGELERAIEILESGEELTPRDIGTVAVAYGYVYAQIDGMRYTKDHISQ